MFFFVKKKRAPARVRALTARPAWGFNAKSISELECFVLVSLYGYHGGASSVFCWMVKF